jgi:Asp-tRNA(Asn)/Glu-tRNA(Gln) amidotransferase A subunit family amidase
MQNSLTPLQRAHEAFLASSSDVQQLAIDTLQHANRNAGKNTYLALDETRIAEEIATLRRWDRNQPRSLLGVPISIKDCFDLKDYRTSCGSKFYATHNGFAAEDSWLGAQVRLAGGFIVGKTHMQQLAYGITGENAEFGDCLQPRDAALLTGGSSSGAAASIQEGSAIVAIGTDTGGSIRVPAALCGLAGYRSSLGIGSWQGAVHLAPSFDTLGLLFRDLRDGPRLAHALFGITPLAPSQILKQPHIAIVREDYLYDCNDLVREAYARQQNQLRDAGAQLQEVGAELWSDSLEIFAAIQAHEAAAIQRQKLAGRADFSVFEPRIADRLAWGESLSPGQIAAMRLRHSAFRTAMDALLREYDFLMLPCAPMHRLLADADHSTTRQQTLRYTTPASLAGMPVVTLPQLQGAGMQLIAARGRDAELLAYASTLHSNIYA